MVSPFVVMEIDYLVETRLGVQWELEVLRELAGGAYHLATMDADDLVAATEVVDPWRALYRGMTTRWGRGVPGGVSGGAGGA